MLHSTTKRALDKERIALDEATLQARTSAPSNYHGIAQAVRHVRVLFDRKAGVHVKETGTKVYGKDEDKSTANGLYTAAPAARQLQTPQSQPQKKPLGIPIRTQLNQAIGNFADKLTQIQQKSRR